MNGKMLSRDRAAHRFACGCCAEFASNGKGRTKDRRQARRRERNNFRSDLANGRYM